MLVDSENDRQEKPEECDSCGSDTANLERYCYFGPRWNVDWLCGYCSRCHYKTHPELSGVAGMLNHLEFTLKQELKTNAKKEEFMLKDIQELRVRNDLSIKVIEALQEELITLRKRLD